MGAAPPQARSAEDGGWGQLIAFLPEASLLVAAASMEGLKAIRLLSPLKAVFIAVPDEGSPHPEAMKTGTEPATIARPGKQPALPNDGANLAWEFGSGSTDSEMSQGHRCPQHA